MQVAYGVDFDSKGNMYLAGYTSSDILSRSRRPRARQRVDGNMDAFVVGFGRVPSSTADDPASA